MAVSGRSADWLDSNRNRAFPFVNDDSLSVEVPDSAEVSGFRTVRIPDCVLLDALVVDTRDEANEANKANDTVLTVLECRRIEIGEQSTEVTMSYCGVEFSFTLAEGGTSGDSSFETARGMLSGEGWSRPVYVSLVFSSHAYIAEHAAAAAYDFRGTVMPTRVAVLPSGSGVDGIVAGGSLAGGVVSGGGVATGDVFLEDGYRTSPIIRNGRVQVRVGDKYGHDPCLHYAADGGNGSDGGNGGADSGVCDRLLFFFCGQNAINSGDIAMRGGKGVSVSQGGSYVARESILDSDGRELVAQGASVPCVEISATPELKRLVLPTTPSPPSPPL